MTKLTLQEAIKSRPDLPVIVFVDNYEIAYDYDTTAQTITRAEVAEVVSFNGCIYDDEEYFVDAYCNHFWMKDSDEKKLEARAHELWEKHAKEFIVCYSHAANLSKGCEIE